MVEATLPEQVFPSLETALKHHFGYDQFRPGQRTVIESILKNQDALVVMPTGGGKSLCYQLPALLKLGVTVVVSPLIALMQDQVDSLQDNGIAATYLNSTLTYDTCAAARQTCWRGTNSCMFPQKGWLVPAFAAFGAAQPDRWGLAALPLTKPTVFRNGAMTFVPNIGSCRFCETGFPRWR
jgi:hypothetical protein